jgi:protocatechuate 3,4-dioxygenase beta subunit
MGAKLMSSRRGFLFAGLACLAAPVFAQQCRRTPDDALGPFYVPGQPAQADLCPRNVAPGMLVTGRVRSFPDCRPVAGALVEVWHADEYGVYTRSVQAVHNDFDCRLRASLRSGEDGRYSFRSIAPGDYHGRPRHIHFRVTASGYRELVTQLYFPPQEGVDPRLLARPAQVTGGAAVAFEFDINIAPA